MAKVTETGWGEFEIGITIHFKEDAGEKPIELFAPLKLYPVGAEVQARPRLLKAPGFKT